MAERIAARDPKPSLVLLSPARRAQETLEPLRPRLASARIAVDERVYAGSAGEILAVVQGAPDTDSCVLVVGHNPALAVLARQLAAAEPSDSLGRLQHFPPGALARVDFDGIRWRDLAPGRARLAALAAPEDERPAGGD